MTDFDGLRPLPDPDPPGGDDGNDGDNGDNGDNGGGRWSADDHLGWKISALLDGELTVAEDIVAREHLTACDRCQDEFAETMAARSLVRDLGAVDVPSGLVDRLLAPDARSRGPSSLGVIGLVTIAAIWILILLAVIGVALPDVQPDLDNLAARHDVAVASPDELSAPAGLSPLDVTGGDGAEVAAPFVAPAVIEPSYEAVVGVEGDDSIQVLYADGAVEISVFEQEGTLDWASLPAAGDEVDLDGQRAWVIEVAGAEPPLSVVVVPRGPLVYSVVTTASLDDALALAGALPDPQAYSVTDRLRKNVEELVGRFGLTVSG